MTEQLDYYTTLLDWFKDRVYAVVIFIIAVVTLLAKHQQKARLFHIIAVKSPRDVARLPGITVAPTLLAARHLARYEHVVWVTGYKPWLRFIGVDYVDTDAVGDWAVALGLQDSYASHHPAARGPRHTSYSRS